MEKKQTFSVHTERDVKLTVEDIDDIMVAALEGGINYWCSEAEVVEERRCADWGHEQIARGGALVLHDIEDSSEKWELDLEKFLNGFKLWASTNTGLCRKTALWTAAKSTLPALTRLCSSLCSGR